MAGGVDAFNRLQPGPQLDNVLGIAAQASFRAVAVLPAILLIVFAGIWLYDANPKAGSSRRASDRRRSAYMARARGRSPGPCDVRLLWDRAADGLQRLQIDVLELDLHRRADVDLEAEQALQCAPLRVVVDEDRGDVAVDDVDDRVAARDEVDRVPVAGLDERLQLVGGAFEIANDLRLPSGPM